MNIKQAVEHVNNVGVYFDANRPGKPWQAYINRGGKRKHLGRFSTKNEAIAAVSEAEAEFAASREVTLPVDAVAIPSAPGYFATPDGEIWSSNYRNMGFPRALSPCQNKKGYWVVRVAGKTIPVHRLVAEAFHANVNGLPQVNHIDGNKGNNHHKNLEWVTNGENAQHAYDIGLNPSHGHRVQADISSAIIAALSDRRHGQQKELAARFGLTTQQVSKIWRSHLIGGQSAGVLS